MSRGTTPRAAPPPCKSARAFVRCHLGKNCFAPCTGQDHRALDAFAHVLELYAASDGVGRSSALAAMVALLSAMQENCWPLAKKMIPHALDGGDEETVWSRITLRLACRPVGEQLYGDES